MNCTQKLIGICDQLVSELETGDFDAAILQLSGMLDGAIAAGFNELKLRDFLAAHPISAFLDSGENDGRAQRSTARRISKARLKITSEKALQQRDEKLAAVLNDAWRKGTSICCFDTIDPTNLKNLAGRDLSNIEFLKKRESSRASQLADKMECEYSDAAKWGGETCGSKPKPSRPDIILAAGIADRMSTPNFTTFLKSLLPKISADGRILISFFLPGHSGFGWRIIRNPSCAFCHDEQKIRTFAAGQGLSIDTYFDSGGCMVWAEFKHGVDKDIGGEK